MGMSATRKSTDPSRNATTSTMAITFNFVASARKRNNRSTMGSGSRGNAAHPTNPTRKPQTASGMYSMACHCNQNGLRAGKFAAPPRADDVRNEPLLNQAFEVPKRPRSVRGPNARACAHVLRFLVGKAYLASPPPRPPHSAAFATLLA